MLNGDFIVVEKMDWNIKNNLKHILPLFALCAVIPHVMLSLLQMASASDSWSPAEIESYSNFFVCEWVPFWASLISYLRLQKRDNFSLLPTLGTALIIASFLPRFDHKAVLTMGLTILLILAVELSAFLKNAESSTNKFFAGMAADRSVLRAFFFWSVGFLCVSLIACAACTYPRTVASPFLMLPIPGILLFDVFRRQNMHPPTVWSILGMLIMIPLSLLLATVGPMGQFKIYHLMSLGIGFALLLLLLIVYNIDHWKK